MAVIQEGFKYSKTHEWVYDEDGYKVIGLSDFAQEELGDLVYVNLPEVGDEVIIGETFADVESVKAVSDVYSPVSGFVAEINEALLDSPEMINSAPYDAWFIKVSEGEESEELMDADDYAAFCEEEKE